MLLHGVIVETAPLGLTRTVVWKRVLAERADWAGKSALSTATVILPMIPDECLGPTTF